MTRDEAIEAFERTALETARMRREAAVLEQSRDDADRNIVEHFYGESSGIEYAVGLLRAALGKVPL
jgi:hypothetical protein